MPTSSSFHRHHRRHSSGKSRQKKVVEEVSTETLVKFVVNRLFAMSVWVTNYCTHSP